MLGTGALSGYYLHLKQMIPLFLYPSSLFPNPTKKNSTGVNKLLFTLECVNSQGQGTKLIKGHFSCSHFTLSSLTHFSYTFSVTFSLILSFSPFSFSRFVSSFPCMKVFMLTKLVRKFKFSTAQYWSCWKFSMHKITETESFYETRTGFCIINLHTYLFV